MIKNKILLTFSGLTIGMCAFAAQAARVENVAAGKTVAANGVFFAGGWGNGQRTDFSSLTDQTYLPVGQQWDQGPIWWGRSAPESHKNSLTVYLGPKECRVRRIEMQVDNNDDYVVSWTESDSGYNQVILVPERGDGMSSRVSVPVSAITTAFNIKYYKAGDGDGFYAVSEFKAFGSCSPERERK